MAGTGGHISRKQGRGKFYSSVGTSGSTQSGPTNLKMPSAKTSSQKKYKMVTITVYRRKGTP